MPAGESRPPRTPSRPAKPDRCDGLVVQLAGGGSRASSISRLQDIVRSTLDGEWQVTCINHKDRLYELLRTRPGAQPTLRQAFDQARLLDAHPAVSFCEIGAIVPGIDPDVRQVYPAASVKAAPKSSGGDRHDACSEPEEWALDSIRAPAAWSLPLPAGGRAGGENVRVAHPDTGYTMHPELVHGGRILFHKGYDFEDDDPDATDPLTGRHRGHGTATASVILSSRDDQSPADPHFVSGVAPLAKLIPIRTSTGVVHLSFRRLVRSIYHAIDVDAHVISMSLGGPFSSDALRTAIGAATDRGIIVVAAAGNTWPLVVYPAKLPDAIAVAASNCRRRPWQGTARGREVDVSAPGESVWRARSKRSDTEPFVSERSSGSSYATAVITGACALWLAYHGRDELIRKYGRENLAAAFRHQLKATAGTPTGWKTDRFGSGIVDAAELLSATLPRKGEVLSAAPAPKRATASAEVLELFPEAPTAGVKTVLARMWGCKPAELDAALAGYDREFRYHLATNPELRSMILVRAKSKKPKGISSRTLAKPQLLGKSASRGLKRRLGL